MLRFFRCPKCYTIEVKPSQESAANLQEKIDSFLVTSHEIRTSLTAMKWMFTMLLAGDMGPLTQSQIALLTEASGANGRLIGLLNDTMQSIRDNTTHTPTLSSASFSYLIEESIKDFTLGAAAKGMHLRYTPAPTPVFVHSNEGKLRIALHNLLDNAIKYGHPNTDISLTLQVEKSVARLTIEDHGAVVADTSKLFDKFYRAPETIESHPGLGIGLYATKEILASVGGSLACIKSDEKSTVFEVKMPIG